MQLLCPLHTAICAPRRQPRFFRIHPTALKVFLEQGQMRSYLSCEFLFCAFVSEQSANLRNHSSPTLHGYDSSIRSFSTGSTICCQRCVFCTSHSSGR